jgi:carbohydrate-binding DOMON domain-containing protein
MSSDDDRLTFGEGPLGGPLAPEPEEEAATRARPNRAFVFIAIAMAGLILLGVLALVAAWRIWLPARKAEQVAMVTNTAVARTMEAAAWTPTVTPSPTALPPTATATLRPTETPIPTATSTRVVSPEEATPQGTPPATRVPSAEGGTTPAAGLGGLGTAAIAVGLAGLILAVRKIRMSG